ncbi:hypothetical protein H0H87_000200 [Tephrocybe sp. NHM501043]|nr:hypothetical protein H0H87_000200 [Tephrocybe sp. NHM501043]
MLKDYSGINVESLLLDQYAPLDDGSPDDMLVNLNLPPLPRQFFVPTLTDKPQNPIMDTLKQEQGRLKPSVTLKLPPELGLLVVDPPVELQPRYNLWAHALAANFRTKNKALSWDRLRPSHPNLASSTGFLSEQDDLVFAAARYHVNLRLRDPAIDMVYVTQNNVLKALKMTVLGTSSVYHSWDPVPERFVQAGVETGCILIDGKDEIVSQSLISRFVTIGTLLRRLETLLLSLRKRSPQEGPTVHAYAHVLTTILMFLRQALARCALVTAQNTLSATWVQYEIYEETFVALAELYGRDETKAPEEYPIFDPAPVPLLSGIYQHLENHLERQSPRTITAIFAFMLTHVSHEYLQQVSRSVGYGTTLVEKAARVTGKALHRHVPQEDDEEEGHEDDLFESLDRLGDTFPDFFPPGLLDILPAAQKSLFLLERAQPHHPMLQRTMTQGTIQWFWTEALVDAASRGHYPGGRGKGIGNEPIPPTHVISDPNEALAIFKLFDLEPGANLVAPAASTVLAEAHTTTQSLQTFIDAFPSSLPSITPTLPHLTSLVLAPLVDHASSLSTALLTLFLTPPTTAQDTLNFQAHLTLLRSYLLLTAPPFKARISAALFSDREAGEFENKAHGLAVRSLRRKIHTKKTHDDDGSSLEQPWAVGLSPSLLERETWPPVGADLSFFLRTVIVDSIEEGGSGYVDGDDGEKVRSIILEEAEYRLGFAIRDLPTGSGKDKWLNPLSIEALDFLYMDYKPPTDVRLYPAAHESRTRHGIPLPNDTIEYHSTTLPNSHCISQGASPLPICRTILRFEYKKGREAESDFPDVFALANAHSALLDDLLSACLLRSGQRAVGEVLRSVLGLILEFTIVVGQLYRGRVEEYEAAHILEDIAKKFFGRMSTLTKVLKGLVDKRGLSETNMLLQSPASGADARRPTGGADALYHLLTRLDLGDWWTAKRR